MALTRMECKPEKRLMIVYSRVGNIMNEGYIQKVCIVTIEVMRKWRIHEYDIQKLDL